MSAISTKGENPLQTANIEDQVDRKLFDNYGPVNVRETIGTFSLGFWQSYYFLPYSALGTFTKV